MTTVSSARKHAGTAPPSDQPPVPEPTFAERARTLMYLGRIGSLSTLSRKQPGFPFGSVMPYGLDGRGRPIFLISTMAMHTQNLQADPRGSLLVTQDDAGSDPLGASRVTLVGNVLPIPEPEVAGARKLYLARYANSKYWVDFEDFSFYRMDVVDVYYVGGFGVMGWVTASARDLAKEVIAKLKLNELPEFDSTLGGVSPVKTVLAMLGIIKNPASMTPEERVLEAYYDRLTVFPVEKSRVIVINFLSEDPELAARVANTIADTFLQLQRKVKQEQAQTAGQVLAGQIETLRKKVVEAESKVEAYRAKTGLFVGNNNTSLSAQQLGDVNAQVAASRAQAADAETKARLIRDMLKSGQPIDSSDILNSELIRRLSEQRVTLRAQLAEQSSTLLDNHPRIKELRAQIADLDGQIT